MKMRGNAVSGMSLMLLLVSMLTLAFGVQPVRAGGTIYIRPDGEVEGTDKIQRDGDSYIFTGNIYDEIVVERGNIIIDGNGHTLQGFGSGNGFSWNSVNNVTVKQTNIKDFEFGIFLLTSYDSNIIENTAANNSLAGIFLVDSENSSVLGNFVTNNWIGIGLEIEVNFNRIVGNKIVGNSADGIFVNDQSNHNSITENYIAENAGGIYIGPLPCAGNFIVHNNFINNANHQAIVASMEPSINTWDDGYPSGGNYWSDYVTRYPDAQELDNSGIWNTPYNIDENNQDNYPLMESRTPTPSTPTEALEELIETIEAWNLPKGTENSLKAKLAVAVHMLDMDKEDGVIRKLAVFIDRVETLRARKLTSEQADHLISEAQRIIDCARAQKTIYDKLHEANIVYSQGEWDDYTPQEAYAVQIVNADLFAKVYEEKHNLTTPETVEIGNWNLQSRVLAPSGEDQDVTFYGRLMKPDWWFQLNVSSSDTVRLVISFVNAVTLEKVPVFIRTGTNFNQQVITANTGTYWIDVENETPSSATLEGNVLVKRTNYLTIDVFIDTNWKVVWMTILDSNTNNVEFIGFYFYSEPD